MLKLNRDKSTGDYYTQDRKYMIEKGCVGWNVLERDEDLMKQGYEIHRYSFSTDTLKEARISIENM